MGILPAGALGCAFFHHLTHEQRQLDGAVFFLERPGSASGNALREAGGVHLRGTDGVARLLPAAEHLRGDLLDCLRRGALPEIVLVVCNPDQLLELVSHVVRFVCEGHRAHGLDALADWMPAIVLCPNGIYFQRVRQVFIEKLEEAEVYDRLPHLRAEFLQQLTGRFLRGVTIQTGVREGAGRDAIYRPGPRGITRLAGGDPAVRARAAALLTARGGWFEDAGAERPTRLEFEKGLVNLGSNLLGQIVAINAEGEFRPLTVAEIYGGAGESAARELVRQVVEVGRAVGAYPHSERFDAIFRRMRRTAMINRDHVPSSLQYVGLMLANGTLRPQLTPTEQWLIEPLIRYARSAGLEEAVRYFEDLRARVIERLRRAIARQAKSPAPDARSP